MLDQLTQNSAKNTISTFWPDSFHVVVYVLGEANALELVKTIGKSSLAIPKSLKNKSGNYIWNRLSPHLKEILHKEFAGDRLYIPSLNEANYEVKTKAILTMSAQGNPTAQIAHIIGEAEEAIYHARRKYYTEKRKQSSKAYRVGE